MDDRVRVVGYDHDGNEMEAAMRLYDEWIPEKGELLCVTWPAGTEYIEIIDIVWDVIDGEMASPTMYVRPQEQLRSKEWKEVFKCLDAKPKDVAMGVDWGSSHSGKALDLATRLYFHPERTPVSFAPQRKEPTPIDPKVVQTFVDSIRAGNMRLTSDHDCGPGKVERDPSDEPCEVDQVRGTFPPPPESEFALDTVSGERGHLFRVRNFAGGNGSCVVDVRVNGNSTTHTVFDKQARKALANLLDPERRSG